MKWLLVLLPVAVGAVGFLILRRRATARQEVEQREHDRLASLSGIEEVNEEPPAHEGALAPPDVATPLASELSPSERRTRVERLRQVARSEPSPGRRSVTDDEIASSGGPIIGPGVPFNDYGYGSYDTDSSGTDA